MSVAEQGSESPEGSAAASPPSGKSNEAGADKGAEKGMDKTAGKEAEKDAEKDTLATRFLEFSDSIVYLFVGICFLLAALFSLIYGLLGFVQSIDSIQDFPFGLVGEKGVGAQTIITLVSDLLLTLIIMEVLGTVVHHLRDKETTLKPFLFIGIISATRGILAVGARLSVSANVTSHVDEFTLDMVELGVNAAVIIALGAAMKLIGPLLDDGATSRRKPRGKGQVVPPPDDRPAA